MVLAEPAGSWLDFHNESNLQWLSELAGKSSAQIETRGIPVAFRKDTIALAKRHRDSSRFEIHR